MKPANPVRKSLLTGVNKINYFVNKKSLKRV